MPNPNEGIFDRAVRRRIAIERYSDARTREAMKFLEDLRRDIVGKLSSGDFSKYSMREQRALLRSVDSVHNEMYAKLNNVLDSDFERMAKDQASFEAGSLRAARVGASVRAVSATQAYAVARSRPMSGRFLKDWQSELGPDARKRLTAALRISFVEGEPLRDAVSRVGEVLAKNGRGVEALIRTANSHIASSVQSETLAQNSDIVSEYEWRSTLDSRTTPVCQVRDGQRYKVGTGPLPPAHVACRSTTTAILDGFPPPKRVTYEDWIKRQSSGVQDEVLGKTKGAAFRAGTVTISSFVSKAGKTKTLKDLGLTPIESQAGRTARRKSLYELDSEAKEHCLTLGRKQGVEHLVAIDELKGTVVERSRGSRSRVYLSEATSRALRDPNRSLVIHHNHPSSSSFSPADIRAMMNPGASGIWAHGHDGSSYFASKVTWDASVKAAKLSDSVSLEAGKLVMKAETYGRYASAVKHELQMLVNTGAIKAEYATKVYGHTIMLALEKAGHIIYRADLAGRTRDITEAVKDQIAAILKKVTR
jgi:SPP1 gp7 family putative phage head morphogenesis protein